MTVGGMGFIPERLLMMMMMIGTIIIIIINRCSGIIYIGTIAGFYLGHGACGLGEIK